MTTVYLGEEDVDLAVDKAQRIFAMLGLEFFEHLKTTDPDRIIAWLTMTLMANDLRVDFDDARDAVLFKMTFGGV